MSNAYFDLKKPANEPVKPFYPGTPEWDELMAEVDRQANDCVDVPCIIGGKEIRTGKIVEVREPQNHKNVLAKYHQAGEAELKMAVEAAMEAKAEWEAMPWEHRVAIFLKAAELLTGTYRLAMDAATMLGQSKNPYEAEIDCVCELADFFRFNAYFLHKIYAYQPDSPKGVWNRAEYRPLEGFVAALSPFNFTSIGGNLASAPAMCGNVVVWKPSTTAVHSNYLLMKLLMEAGLPAGVINFVPSAGRQFGETVVGDRRMAGFHFTGSTGVFNSIWNRVGSNIEKYDSYPRLVGETGGKDFVFAHKSANPAALACGLIKGAFAYQGQKCSAASRAYVPESLWPALKDVLHTEMSKIKTGDIRDPKAFVNAVIDKKSFDNIAEYIEYAKKDPYSEIIEGGTYDDSVGYFIQPTVILAKTPKTRTMLEEIFGPVLTIYVYPDAKYEDILHECATATKYALTGAIYAEDRAAIAHMEKLLMDAAGNFYINDKPTGAVVGQQPFGGARGSGSNDKAGSIINMYRWLSQRVTKEVMDPETDFRYAHMK